MSDFKTIKAAVARQFATMQERPLFQVDVDGDTLWSAAELHDALLAFEIVKHVIRVRVAERDQAKEAADRKEKKQRLLELIAKKQDDELAGKSIDELRALAESL